MMLTDSSNVKFLTFQFNKNELQSGKIRIQWIEDDEFRYENKMYDVVKYESHGDSVYLYCIEDENESSLYSYYDKYFQKLINEDPGKEEDLEAFRISFSQFYSKPPLIGCNSQSSLDGNYFTVYDSNLLDGVQFSFTPPPRS